MSDARILHKKASGSERVCRLDHLQHRVWVQYVLSADDYGVLRYSVSGIRHDNPRLESEPMKKVVAALKAVVDSGLVQIFAHQGNAFLWQPDWQDFQGVRYPRATVNPAPSMETLTAVATPRTRDLFVKEHHQYSRQRSGENVETLRSLAGAGAARNPNPTSTSHSGSAVDEAEDFDSESLSAEPPAFRRAGESDSGLTHRPGVVEGGYSHRRHAWCGRVCVPDFLHAEFTRKLGRSSADSELRAWYADVEGSLAGQPIGDDTVEFWKNQFAGWVGTVTSRPTQSRGSRTGDSRNAAVEFLTERHGHLLGGSK